MRIKWGLQALKDGISMKEINKKRKSIVDEVVSEKHTIKYDNFDLRNFKEITDANPKLKEIYHEGIDNYPQFKELHQDIFDALYKYSPQKFDENQIDYEYLLNSKVMDSIINNPKYKEMRLLTRLDIVNATMGSQVIGEQAKDLVKELKDQLQDAMANAKQAAQAISSEDSEDDADTEEAKSEKSMTLEEAKKLLEESMQKIDDVVTEKVEYKIQNILGQALMETRKTSNVIKHWGLDSDPHYRKTGYQEKIKILDKIKNSEKLKQLADLAGRYKRWAIATHKSKTKYGVDSIRGVTIGSDIGKLLPTEAMKLQNPILKTVFKKDLLENKLFQYEYNHQQKESAGPIICCIDSSGSMWGPAEIWAKAVALGLLEIARHQNRSFYAIHFSSGYHSDRLHVNDFNKKKPYSITNVIDLAEYFEGGGTAFEPPLNAARKQISTEKDFSKADIVFITDGASAVRNTWLRDFLSWKKLNKVNIYSVLLDCGYNYKESLEEFSDDIILLSKLNSTYFDKTASVLFKMI